MSKFIAASAGLALAATALAVNPMSFNGQGGAIPDNGGPANQFSSTVNTNVGSAFTVLGVSFNGLSHTWAGDLIMTLTGPGAGNSFNFFYRPGQTTPTAVGQNVDFSTANAYSFSDAGIAWNTAQTGIMPGGDYVGPRSPFAPVQAINSFAGLNGTDGAWTLTISDNAGLDAGGLNGWSLIVKAVPTPGAAALFGLAGVAGLRRRR